MNIRLILIFILVHLNRLHSQNSFDSLRMVLPLGHNGYINNIIENPKRDLFLTLGNDNNLFIWNSRTVKLLNNNSSKKIYFAEFDYLDSNNINIINELGLFSHNLENWEMRNYFAFDSKSFINLFSNSKTKQYYLITKMGIYVLSESFEKVNYIKTNEEIESAKYNSLSNVLYAQSHSGKIYSTDLQSLMNEHRLIISDSLITSFDISENGIFLLTFGKKTKLKLWNTFNLKSIPLPFDTGTRIHFAKFSRNNLICSTFENKIFLYDSESKDCLSFKNFDALVIEADIDYLKNVLITCDKKTKIKFFDLNDQTLIHEIVEIKSPVYHIDMFSQSPFIFLTTARQIYAINRMNYHITHVKNNAALETNKFNSFKGKMVACTTEGQFYSIDFLSSELSKEFYEHSGLIWDIQNSKALNDFYTSSSDGLIKKWNLSNNISEMTFIGHQNSVRSITLNSDETKLFSASNDGSIRIWDVASGYLYDSIILNGKAIRSIEKHPKKDIFLAATWGKSIYLLDKDAKIIDSITDLLYDAEWGGFNQMGDFIIVKLWNNHFIGYQFSESYVGKKLLIEDFSTEAINILLSPDKNIFSKITVDSTLVLYDIFLNIELTSSEQPIKALEPIQFSQSGNYLLFVGQSGNLELLNTKNGKVISKSNIQVKNLSLIEFIQGDNLLVTVENGKGLQFWDIIGNTIKPIMSYFPLIMNNWLVKLPNSPYYMCSKDASKMLHYVTPSLKVIGFEQLDPVYNRPDIVLDSIGKYFGGADAELVANYRESWEKRIDRLGLDKEKLGKGDIAVPDAEIVDADKISYENKEGKLVINVKTNDPKYTLRRFNVYVNEVPLYGSAGISIAHLNTKSWTTTDTIPLSVGENKIQVSVMNELGLENFKYPTYVNYTPEKNKEIFAKTHYIGIGVNEFKEAGHNLNYCVKDVRDLAKAFSAENTQIDTLLFTDEQVTRENILALKDYLKKTSVNDKVIISCSSHGLLDDSLNFYLAMYDVDFKNPKARGLKYEELEGLLDGIPARQKLLLLDACNSGENDKTEVLKKELEEKKTRMDSTQFLAARGVIIKLEEENKTSFKKMNELFVNVRNNTGSVIISAAGGQESALEAIQVDGKIIENGAFTYSILECLKQNVGKELKVNTLKQYAEKRVEEITNGKQKPTSRQETMEVDWRVR